MFGMLFMLIEYHRLHGVQFTFLIAGNGNEKAIAHLHLPPGLGEVDFGAVFGALAAIAGPAPEPA